MNRAKSEELLTLARSCAQDDPRKALNLLHAARCLYPVSSLTIAFIKHLALPDYQRNNATMARLLTPSKPKNPNKVHAAIDAHLRRKGKK